MQVYSMLKFPHAVCESLTLDATTALEPPQVAVATIWGEGEEWGQELGKTDWCFSRKVMYFLDCCKQVIICMQHYRKIILDVLMPPSCSPVNAIFWCLFTGMAKVHLCKNAFE